MASDEATRRNLYRLLEQAVAGQTRMMVFTMAGTVVSLGGMAFALARFA